MSDWKKIALVLGLVVIGVAVLWRVPFLRKLVTGQN